MLCDPAKNTGYNAHGLPVELGGHLIAKSDGDGIFQWHRDIGQAPGIRITVSLAASTGTNWSCSCEPSTIVIADELPHPFTCNVTVPEAAQNQTTTLTVDAIGTGIGFEHTYGQAEATIVVHGTAPINKTGGTGERTRPDNQTNGEAPEQHRRDFKDRFLRHDDGVDSGGGDRGRGGIRRLLDSPKKNHAAAVRESGKRRSKMSRRCDGALDRGHPLNRLEVLPMLPAPAEMEPRCLSGRT